MRNIYVFQVLTSTITGIFASCSIVNLLAGGMNIENACLAFGILALTTASLELPTGWIADKMSRKLSTLSGISIACIAYLVLYFTAAPTLSYLAMGILALSNALISGAQEAWFVSHYKAINPTKKSMDQFFLTLQLYARAGMILGGLTGPYLMTNNPSYVWLSAAFIAGLALSYGLLAVPKEEKVSGSKVDGSVLKDMIRHLNTPVAIFLGCSMLIGIDVGARNIVIQPYIMDMNLGVAYMLSIVQILCIASRMTGIIIYKKILIHLNQRTGFICLSFVMFAIAQYAASWTDDFRVFVGLYCLAILSYGWQVPLLQSYVNSIVDEKYRATFLSLSNMIDMLGQAITSFALAATISRGSLQPVWLISSYAAALTPLVLIASVAASKVYFRSQNQRGIAGSPL